MIEGCKHFFHSFIDAVLIGPESAVIRYTIGGNRITPTEFGPPAGSYVHEINLVHEHTVAEILVCPGDSPLRRNAEVCACGAERLVDLDENPTDGWRIWKPMPDLNRIDQDAFAFNIANPEDSGSLTMGTQVTMLHHSRETDTLITRRNSN